MMSKSVQENFYLLQLDVNLSYRITKYERIESNP